MYNNSHRSTQSTNTESNNNFALPLLPHPSSSLHNKIEEDEDDDDNGLTKFLGLLQRRILVIVGVSLSVMTVISVNLILSPKPPVYESSFRLLVEPVNEDSKAVDVIKESNSNQSGLDYDSQILILKSPEVMGSVLNYLKISYPQVTYDNLLSSLNIQRLEKTKFIEVSYSGQDPNQVKAVLDQTVQAYLKYSQEGRKTKLRQGIQFVDKKLPFLQNRIDNIQRQLQILRQRYNLNDPEFLTGQITSQAGNLVIQRQELNLQVAQIRSNLALLKGKHGEEIALKDAPIYQQLMGQIRNIDVQIAASSTVLKEENPIIKTLIEQRNSLLPLARQEAQNHIRAKFLEIETQLNFLEVRNQELTKNEQQLEQKRKELPILSKQYTDLQRQLQFATESLNRFLSARENLQIQISQTELGWQLIKAPSLPQYPLNSANLMRNLLQGFAASLLLGIGAAFLIEKTDNTYHSIPTLKQALNLPLLGSIPFEKQLQSNQSTSSKIRNFNFKTKNILLQDTPRDNINHNRDSSTYSAKFLEALRVLYTNIQLLNSDRQLRSLVISSACAGDGKSTIAFHLACIATAMEQKVLLVDANFRQPTIHQLANLDNKSGLSNLISTNLSISEVIMQPPSIQELSLITAGSLPPDPIKLLSSQKMKQLMTEFHQKFDLVIYDVPPLLGLADASLITSHTDGTLVVVKIDQTDSSILKRTIDDLKISPVNILGVVGNAFKNRFGD